MTPRRRGRRHEDLRRATAAAHAALDATLLGAGCFSSIERYRRYLGAVAPLYAAIETSLDAAGAARLLPDWPRRRKLDLVRAELRAFGFAPDALDRPAVLAAMRASDPGDIFGALYVLEGATLGGALLARSMRGLGLLAPGAPCLLDPYGAERGAMWRAFLARLEAVKMTYQQELALGARAMATFSLFATVGESLMDREDAR
ncbi:MAG: biliverdin-producing heme oxygenase [Acetobacteraceae bacterium]|nr:biliverdin-producing heme oxygenase [Acetobacteraceae bacterium]